MRRPDGFHDLTTVFHAVSLSDELTATRSGALTLTLHGEGADELPLDGANLAVRAVQLLAAGTGNDPHVALSLVKGIPVAGGCAGGSADAAAALVACDALWGTGLSRDELGGYAARLGSDVPFALHGGTALGTGRGERLTAVLGQGTYAWVLAVADGGLSTPDVYAELDRQRAGAPPVPQGDPSAVLAALRSGNPVMLGHALTNDLQPAAVALRPDLDRLLAQGRELGALGVLVSGSGPTVALLAQDSRHADELATELLALGSCRAVRRADGPAAGARVVG
ncbi:MAG: 4-(cytidine 5-diphospho)-2-C-methyl-D-erythritol kinase [Frankiales bacterium]|nr:4-(cytidine 5-diphospho)-2-C-methyl-D-erythritol kinase [Frankiales bacterium]